MKLLSPRLICFLSCYFSFHALYAAEAESPLSGTAAITSNYVFRGVSQTENNAAVQVGATYQFPIGLYFNIWGSNVKFPESDAYMELDTIAGWRGDLFKENFRYDLSISRYNYPDESDLTYNELVGVFSYQIFVLTLGYSQDEYATHQTGTYVNMGINYTIPEKYVFHVKELSILATAGHSSLSRDAGNSYNDYYIGLTKAFNDIYSATAAWTTTNGRQHDSPYDSTHIFAQVAANF